MKNDSIKFTKRGSTYTITRHFAERVLKHYSRRIGAREMPDAIAADLTSPDKFGKAVNAKSGELVKRFVKEFEGDEARADRKVHAAMEETAKFFDLPAPPLPNWLRDKLVDEPKPEPKPKAEKGKSDEGEKEDGDEESENDGPASDGGCEGDGDEEGECNGSGAGEGEGEAKDGDGEGEGTTTDAETEEGQGGGSSAGDPDGPGKNHIAPEPIAVVDTQEMVEELKNRVIDAKRKAPKIQSHPIQKVNIGDYHDMRSFGNGSNLATVENNYGVIDISFGNQLMARMRAELSGMTRHKHTRDRESGHVDTEKKLADLATGSNLDKAFYTVTPAKRLNAAVQIVVDVSGSMGAAQPNMHADIVRRGGAGVSMVPAIQCCLLLTDCLERLRIPVEIVIFDDSAYLLKGWNDKLSTVRDSIRCLHGAGGTSLTNAMATGLKSLGMRKESKHVMAVITDGDVGNSGYIRDLLKQDHKLRTYGFGVGVDLPAGVFSKMVCGLKPSNMVDAIVDQLRAAVLADAR